MFGAVHLEVVKTSTRCPPSAGRVRARAAADELRVAGAPRHAARAFGGRASRGASPARPPPEGEGGIGSVWAIPGGIRCAGTARRGRARQRARPVRSPSEKAGVPSPLSPGRGRRAALWLGYVVVCVVGARAYLPEAESFCWFVYFMKVLHLQF